MHHEAQITHHSVLKMLTITAFKIKNVTVLIFQVKNPHNNPHYTVLGAGLAYFGWTHCSLHVCLLEA